MYRDKESSVEKKPRKLSWWATIGVFFSNLFKSSEQIRREELDREKINLAGENHLVLQSLTTSLSDPNYRDDLSNRLASGSLDISNGLLKFVLDGCTASNIPAPPEKIYERMVYLKLIIETAETIDKERSRWGKGEADVPGSWNQWKAAIVNAINNLELSLKQNKSKLDRVSAPSYSANEEELEKTALIEFFKNGLTDPTYRAKLKAELADGKKFFILAVPQYLTVEMRKLKEAIESGENTEDLVALNDRLNKIRELAQEVESGKKSHGWELSNPGLSVMESSKQWVIAIENSTYALQQKINQLDRSIPLPEDPKILRKAKFAAVRSPEGSPRIDRAPDLPKLTDLPPLPPIPESRESKRPTASKKEAPSTRAPGARPLPEPGSIPAATRQSSRPPGARPLPKIDSPPALTGESTRSVPQKNSFTAGPPRVSSRPAGAAPLRKPDSPAPTVSRESRRPAQGPLRTSQAQNQVVKTRTSQSAPAESAPKRPSPLSRSTSATKGPSTLSGQKSGAEPKPDEIPQSNDQENKKGP